MINPLELNVRFTHHAVDAQNAMSGCGITSEE
jgi:hypothetical protein